MQNTPTIYEYYKENLYPFELIHRLMTMNRKKQSGEARILALQYPGDTNVWVSYDYKRETVGALRSRMLISPQKPPESLHLGLFRENYGERIVMGKKELVFDLDITDYERYCSCRGVKKLCPICWIQMQGSSLILEHILQHTLGYKAENRMWVFSGGKGLHCFVNDAMAMKLGDDERKQLHKRLFIGQGDDSRLSAFINTACAKHPDFVKRVEDFFITHMIKGVNIFALSSFLLRDDSPIEESFELSCLRYLRAHHPTLAQLVKGAWDGITPGKNDDDDNSSPVKRQCSEHNISVRKWRAFQQLGVIRQDLSTCRPDLFIIFRLFFPMIDAGPLKIGHQIKAPFSVHWRSQNIALPLSHEHIMAMNILVDVLTVKELCQLKKAKKPLATSFLVGLELQEKYLNTYPV